MPHPLLFSANQITWSILLIKIHILIGKQCRSRSVGFFRSQLIWIYTVCKGRSYPGSAGQGLTELTYECWSSISGEKIWATISESIPSDMCTQQIKISMHNYSLIRIFTACILDGEGCSFFMQATQTLIRRWRCSPIRIIVGPSYPKVCFHALWLVLQCTNQSCVAYLPRVCGQTGLFCLCWGFTAQSTQWGHVERSQFT